jgi:hypothetical protein
MAICENKVQSISKDLSRIVTFSGQTVNLVFSGMPNTSITITKDGEKYEPSKTFTIGLNGKYEFAYVADKSTVFSVKIGENQPVDFKIKVYNYKFTYALAVAFGKETLIN